MTRLGVDELIAAVVGEPRRRDVVVDEAVELGVGQAPARRSGNRLSRIGWWQAASGAGTFQTSGRANRPECVICRPRYRSPSAFDPKCSRCARDELVAQRGDRLLGRGRQHQLVGIGAAIVADGHRFSAPHQLRAALAEIPPSAARQVARLSRRACRPTLPSAACRSDCPRERHRPRSAARARRRRRRCRRIRREMLERSR